MKLGNLNYRLSRQERNDLCVADRLFMVTTAPDLYVIAIRNMFDGKTYVIRSFKKFRAARLFGTFCHRYTGLFLYFE